MVSALILSVLLSLATAQTTTISVPWLGMGSDAQELLADMRLSIVSANPTATTVAVACIPNTDCGLFPAQTVVFGPSTYNIDMSDPSTDFTATIDCVLSKAVCKETAGGSEANFPGSSTETYDSTDIGTYAMTVTAGADKLDGKAVATSRSESEVTSAAAVTRSSASAAVASVTSIAVSGTSASSSAVASQSTSVEEAESGAAVTRSAAVGSGLLGVAMGVFGGLLL